jgi:cell division protein FtsL
MPRGAAAPARPTRTGGAPARRARPKAAPGRHAPAKPAGRRRVSGPAPKAHKGKAAPAKLRNGKAAPAKPRKAPSRRKAATVDRPMVLRPAPAGAPLAIRVARAPFVRALRHRGRGVLDSLLSGQGWIALIGLLLVGIVFFNVSLLELNRNITRTSTKVAQIKQENAKLRTDVAKLGSSERIQTAAAAEGLVLPAPGDVRYLKVNPTVDARRAAKRITEPTAVALVPPPSTPDPVMTTPPAETTATTTTPTETAPTDTTSTAATPPTTTSTTPTTSATPAPQTGTTATQAPTG